MPLHSTLNESLNNKQGMRLLAPPEKSTEAMARRGIGLEDELGAYLTDTSRRGAGGLPELAAVSVAHHTLEVGMVEDIEHLEAHIELHALGDFRVFLNARIRGDGSRTGEDVLLRAASDATNFVAAAEVTGEG